MAQESVAVVGGRVVPVTGDPIDNGTVLAEAGRITAVGTGLVIWSGDPLDALSRVERALIGGAEIYTAAGTPEWAEPR